MSSRPSWVIEPLNSSKHVRGHFSCGNEALDSYLKKQASQDVKKKLAKVFVVRQPNSSSIIGFYTLSAASFNKSTLPTSHSKKLPYSNVPAVLIGRLAVDQTWQGKKLGEYLLIDACQRVVETSQNTLAINAIIVQAKDQSAKDFYFKYGFIPFMDEPLHLFIPIRTLENANKI
jgi:predicted GNAT family N-acyltransferase